jgi:AraC family transcriptional regulator
MKRRVTLIKFNLNKPYLRNSAKNSAELCVKIIGILLLKSDFVMQEPNNQTQTNYTSRINAVFDYIEEHLDEDISLDELARVSCFSKYHFSRIFDAIVGETPFEFIKRIRLEKAASLLWVHPQQTVTEIALECGFNNLEFFSRNFKDHFNKTPTEWRNGSAENRNYDQAIEKTPDYVGPEVNRNQNMESLQQTEVRDLPDKTVAYVRHTGPYTGDETLFNRLFGKLFAWAGPRGLMKQHSNAAPLAIYHDDPCVTPKEKLRLSICLPVPPKTPVDGEIGKMEIKGGRFLVARFNIAPYKMPDVWQWIYGSWLPASGYQPADALPYKVYTGEPEDGKLTVDICVPLKPL